MVFRRAARLVMAVLAVGAVARAQLPIDSNSGEGRSRLRDRYNKPQSSQRLDESIRKFNADDVETRLEGIKGLGEANDPKATEYLLQAASDPDMRIRIKAIDTLGNIHAKEATPLLIQQLFLRDTDAATKQRILVALGKIGDQHATKPILDFLSRDMDAATRGTAIFALGDIGDRAALEPLDTLAKNSQDETARRLAADAARKIRERPAPAVVPPALAIDRREPPPGATP
jgi:HEAT repeat protein